MISKKAQTIVEKATVTLTKKGGRGVLVCGHMILTAAHCVDYSLEGGMILGDYYLEDIKTSQGEMLKAVPYAIEPVYDIAALGALDNQEFIEEVKQFNAFCEKIEPVPLCQGEFMRSQKFQVFVYTHTGTWVTGTAEIGDNPMIWLEFDAPIEGGTSGGPVVNECGELVAVISKANVGSRESNEAAPYPYLALPGWITRLIFCDQEIEPEL